MMGRQERVDVVSELKAVLTESFDRIAHCPCNVTVDKRCETNRALVAILIKRLINGCDPTDGVNNVVRIQETMRKCASHMHK